MIMIMSKGFSQEIKLEIANYPLALFIDDASSGKWIEERYKAFASEMTPEFSVHVNTSTEPVSANFMAEVTFHYEMDGNLITFDIPGYHGKIDLSAGEANLYTSKNRVVETTDYLLRVIVALIIFKKGGLLFHGAGIIRNNATYLFFGHSGSGKSTVARLSPNDIVINDDLVVLLPQNGEWLVHATPFWNPTQVKPVPAFAPLKGLYRLVQDKKVYLEPIAQGQALAELISNIPVIPDNPFLNTQLFNRGKELLDMIPTYRLHFLPDESFWQVVLAGE